jgi:alpha-beta hydrolase superfamily lysophospholipase
MHRRNRICVATLVGGLFLAVAATAFGQFPKKGTPGQPPPKGFPPKTGAVAPKVVAPTAPKVVAPASPAAKGKGPKLPEPEDVTLETNDGVSIKATYYAGTAKKETVPVIMVHGFEGQRGEYHRLALYLQTLGHASIVPDLRGHGQSKIKKTDGGPVTLDVEKFTRRDLEDMVRDVEACKKFLLEKNNAGELNIEMLTVIGAEFGGIVAVRWAAADWAARDLPAYKQGRDVKGIVLLSPMASFKAVTMREALVFPPIQSQVSMMLVAGARDSKATAEAKKIYDSLQRHHPKLPDDAEERRRVQELYLIQPEANLSGTKLLADAVVERGLTVKEIIGDVFIKRRLVDRKSDFPWQDRQSPL